MGAVLTCVFSAVRGADVLFGRSVELPSAPRVGDRVSMWFPDVNMVRGQVRTVQWTIGQDGAAVVNVQVQIAAADLRRFARRTALDT